MKGFDIDEKAMAKCEAVDVKAVGSLREVSEDVDYIVTSLPKTEHVEEVLLGDGGVFSSANEGTVICDTSTISPAASARFAQEASKRGLTFVDAPVTGGTMGAQAGTLNFLVGAASQEAFENARVVLFPMGRNVFHCGEPGTGEIAKIVNNMIIGMQMIAVSEGLALGEKLGIDPHKLTEILQVSTSSCWATNGTNPRPGVVPTSPASNNYEGGFQTELMRKDMSLALELAQQVDSNADLAHKTMLYY